jgi:ferrous iron transport protein A
LISNAVAKILPQQAFIFYLLCAIIRIIIIYPKSKIDNMQLLSQLNIGAPAVISAIEADESLFHRLSALGFRVGKPLSIIRRANFKGPLQVRLGTTDVILRAAEAARIRINTL